ncbi:NlpC/P60 family protein [Clostridium weizhouense]|uniref:C40 family peptidase n=1 Tax=Clostridium weizhouense TaxID=2859781 RepID=A0ABS7AMP8_9CLOT|nr:NlpC/P60 family protein [Clostridium weizhouense]MBW6408961.1 C40 family peptidase [Clostridium weizhouense]
MAKSSEELEHMSIGKAQSLGTKKVNELLGLNNLKNENGEEAEAINNTLTATDSIIKKYGIIQDIIFKSKKEDASLKAKRILNENCKPKETIEVECIGDINYRVGFGVHLVAPFLKGYEDCFMYIKEVEHEWKSNNLFISKLTLTPSRVMDEVEWSDLSDDEDEEGSSVSSSALWEKIYSVLKQQEGKPYAWGKHGPDTFDCSGLVEYCYNQYTDELGLTIGWTTYEQCKQGSEVDKDNKDSWEPGDLLFWKADPPYPGHVSVYLGNNRMLHAPKHNDIVKTVDVTRTDIYSVRRVIPPSKSGTYFDINIGGIPEEYLGNLTAVESNCNTFISNMSKYGYKDIIINKSNAYKIDSYITAAIIAIESEGNPYCGSSYYGLMQVSGGSSDPANNIEQGLKEYKQKMSAVGIQPHVIFSAYNSGEGTVLNACKQNGYNASTVTVKQLGDALYDYVKAHNPSWDANEKKYYSSKVLKAYSILKSKNALK